MDGNADSALSFCKALSSDHLAQQFSKHHNKCKPCWQGETHIVIHWIENAETFFERNMSCSTMFFENPVLAPYCDLCRIQNVSPRYCHVHERLICLESPHFSGTLSCAVCGRCPEVASGGSKQPLLSLQPPTRSPACTIASFWWRHIVLMHCTPYKYIKMRSYVKMEIHQLCGLSFWCLHPTTWPLFASNHRCVFLLAI